MSDDSKQSEKILSELLPESVVKLDEIRTTARKQILESLTTMLETAYRRGIRTTKSQKLQQRWFTIFGYLAQVSTRVARDIEYEKLRAEVDELKRQVLGKNATRLRSAITPPRRGPFENGGTESTASRDSDRPS